MAIKTSDVVPFSQARSRLSEIADEVKADAAPAYDALLSDLETTVMPNLERLPRMGRPFFNRGAGSVETHAKIERFIPRIGDGELREYLSGD